MRIVHVSDCYLPRTGGIERQVHDLAARQHRRGDDVQVVTSTVGAGRDHDGIRVVEPSSRRATTGTIRYAWSQRGRDEVLGTRADVVHLHASAFSPLSYVSAFSLARAGMPVAVTVHSLWAYATPLFRTADVLTGWGQWPLAWSAVSDVAAEQVRRIVGAGSRVSVVPNGVDAPSWRVEALPRDPKRVVVATVGRLAPRKRPLHLLRMLRQARARIPSDIRLEALVIGDGPLRARVEHAVGRHRMGDWVRLHGEAEHAEIRSLYRDVDLYVAAATLESFGIAALEARSAGLPVVAYRDSGVGDFIRHDVDGLLAADDDEMVDGIVRLASRPAELRRLQRHNTETPPPVTWEAVLDRCDDLYAEAAELATRPAAVRGLTVRGPTVRGTTAPR